ncbi:MAG: glycosyltransferase family 2 protein [Saprospiraceae bacterium]
MKFSIITVSYNQADYLEQCILSVLDQDYKDIEYIIIDGGSTDHSVEIIKKYASKISYWISEPDQGPSNALNKGLDKVTGDVVGFINSDDYLLPDAISELHNVINSKSGFDVYYSPGYIKDERADDMRIVYPTLWNLGCYRAGLTIMMQQSIFIRSKYLRDGLRFNEKNTTHWDGELLVDLDLAGARFYRHSAPISVFRIHQQSITGQGDNPTTRLRYQNEIKVVNRKIDQQRPSVVKSKMYWWIWLIVFDSRNMIRRLRYKLRWQ